MERRNFIKKSVAGSAGALFIPTILPSNMFASTSANRKINVGQIGCGRIAVSHDMPGVMMHDAARLIAVSDVDSNRMKDGKKFAED